MLQRRQQAPLALQPGPRRGVGQAADQLDRHAAAEGAIVALGSQHRPHAALADLSEHAIGTDALGQRARLRDCVLRQATDAAAQGIVRLLAELQHGVEFGAFTRIRAGCVEEGTALRLRQRGGRVEQLPQPTGHAQAPRRRRRKARPKARSRSTVATETCRASADSSALMPPK